MAKKKTVTGKKPANKVTKKTTKKTAEKKTDTKKAAPSRAATTRSRPSSLLDTRVVYCGDNLEQLAKLPDNCIDLIYIDPPFNSNRNYEVFWGETKEKRAFEDRHASTQAYIDYMRPRCEQLKRVLKNTGSFYYHCDWHASHYVKVMLDQIFGANNFLNNIVWMYGLGGSSKRYFPRKHDDIFFYAKKDSEARYFEPPMTPATSNRMQGQLKKCPDYWDIPSLNNMSKERLGYPTQKPLELLERIVQASSKPNDIVLDAFCGCGTALVAAQQLDRQWIGIDISPTACRVMAKRLRDVCKMRESEPNWLAHKTDAFVVRDLPWTIEKLRELPPFEFENWAVIALGGIPNTVQVGDMGIDGRIFPVGTKPEDHKSNLGANMFAGDWFPVQVKQKDRVGRPDIDQFEAVMEREDRQRGFFVAFGYTSDAEQETANFHKRSGRIIKLITVQEILDEQHVQKM